MKRYLIISLLLIQPFFAQESRTRFQVDYMSAEHVYLSGGTEQGLQVGDRLVIGRNRTLVARLEVIFVARYSASCKILSSPLKVRPGDTAILLARVKSDEGENQKKNVKRRTQKKAPAIPLGKRSPEPLARFSGSASVQLLQLQDNAEIGLDFFQTSTRLNFRMHHILGKELTLRARTRVRYNERVQDYLANAVQQQELRNRVYELYLDYHDDESLLNYKLGRIYTRRLSGLGNIDGAQVEMRLLSNTRLGVMAGFQPNLFNSNFQTDIQKYGAYLHFAPRDVSIRRFETTLAAVMEYSGQTISREFLYFQNTYSRGSRFSIFQSVEVDINRKWRQARTGKAVTLSNFYVAGRYRFSDAVSAGLTFDNRQNYYSIEFIDIDEFLFDAAPRTGIRGSLSLQLPGQLEVNTGGGFRTRNLSSSDATFSFSAGVSRRNLMRRRISLGVSATGFSEPFSDGLLGTIQVGKQFVQGHRVDLSYLRYAYTIRDVDLSRANNVFRINTSWIMFRSLVIAGLLDLANGDDLQGPRMLFEVGYIF